MSLKLTSFLFALILFIILRGTLSIKKGYYTIVAPATVRPDSVFHVSFTLNDFHKSCWFNISLTVYPDRNKIYGLESIEVKPGTTKLVELQAPSSNDTFAFLEVLGYRGIISKESEIIYLEAEKFWGFVQTDKAKYKPGELVKFRIICIDQLTRPAKLREKINVKIYDRGNLIKTYLDVKVVQGVFRSEFQLSEHPNLGKWRIKVLTGNTFLTYKDFEVVRYVLPKFNVIISNTKEVSMHDDQMILDLDASYFYGEPVKGNLTITVTSILAPYPEVVPTLTRQSQIHGNYTIVLDLKNDLMVKPRNITKAPSGEFYTFRIEAILIDEVTEEQSRASIEIGVHTKPYFIELKAPKTFDSDALLNMKVQVLITDLNGNSIQDTETETPIEIIAECSEKPFREIGYKPQEKFRIEYKNQIGKDFAIIQVTNKNYSECFLYAEYKECISLRAFLKKTPTSFDMDILTESPQEGKELEIKIKNPDPIEEFTYEIVSRGDVIQAGLVNVPGNETSYILRLNVTSLMVPKITIYAHFIKNMGFTGQLKDVLIKRAFQNSIKITTDNETNPGKSVYINVTTNEGSYVGLMGLDPSALQSIEKKNILNEDYVNWQLGSVNSINFYYHTPFYYRTEDIITFSNALPPGYGGGVDDFGPQVPPKRVRKLFPDSWLFMDFQRTPAGGFNILETAPDSITTWAITGFSIHPETGLTFTKNTTNLKVFQEFFVSMDFPSLVKQGEIIEIPVYISNYMNQEALTNVTIETNSEDLDILDHPEASSKSKQNISKLIAAKKREKIVIFLKPLKPGNYNVTVHAISSVASDAVQKTLNVQPQGIPYAMSKTYLVHLPEESIQEDEITIDIPANAVPGSQRVEVSVVGDIFQPLMKYLQGLARVPYGNGEENMRLIVSNSIVLKYLKVLNYSNPSLENKMRSNIELGYQNQLSFKFLDGSFGLFDRTTQRTGDIWQTILSLWGLEQANEFVPVDSEIIDRGLQYLKSKQDNNGCLKSGNGIEEDVKFTAFGLMAFLMDEPSNTTYNETIGEGLTFLSEITDDLEYSPISVMSAYALLLGKHDKAGDHLTKLTSNSHSKSKQTQWTNPDTLESHLEAIAGTLMNLFESKDMPEQGLLQIVRGLIISKKEESSITHMIALQAMIAFVDKLLLSRTNLDITFKDDQNKAGNFQINADNSQVLQTFEISQSSRKIHLQSKGHGFAVVDVRYNYNLVPEDQSSSFFSANISTKKISKYFGVLKICVTLPENDTINKLTVMEVNLQSGFIFTEKDSQKVEYLGEHIKSLQVNGSRDKVVVYFELMSIDTCMELEFRKTFNVINSKPGWVIVYAAHDKDQRAAQFLKFNDF